MVHPFFVILTYVNLFVSKYMQIYAGKVFIEMETNEGTKQD